MNCHSTRKPRSERPGGFKGGNDPHVQALGRTGGSAQMPWHKSGPFIKSMFYTKITARLTARICGSIRESGLFHVSAMFVMTNRKSSRAFAAERNR